MLEYNAIMAGQAEGDENLVLEQAQEIANAMGLEIENAIEKMEMIFG